MIFFCKNPLYTSLQNRTTNRPAPNENSRTDSDGTGPQVSSGAPLSKLQPIWKNYLESLFARSAHLDTLCEADMINGDWMKQIVGCQEWRQWVIRGCKAQRTIFGPSGLPSLSLFLGGRGHLTPLPGSQHMTQFLKMDKPTIPYLDIYPTMNSF